MLICRMGVWRIESDGHLSALELASLKGLRTVEAERIAEAAQERARLAMQVRELKRRAWRRGHSAGKAAALREHVGRAAAAAFAANRLQDRLTQIVLSAVSDIVGGLPPSATLTNQLRRAVAVSQSQRLVSVRVARPVFKEAAQLIETIEQELGTPLCTVLADAGLPAHSCVIETEAGVIDGGLKVQLRALERGIRDGVAQVLRTYDLADGSGRTALDHIERGVRLTLAVLATPQAPPPPISPIPGRVVQRQFVREAA
ncbi:flagellar biosynthesis protein [Paraburkholderia fungorum]|uniref:flagellar biosynthesis protein n=1 Tax=Paraburkholderia fungorum TaxID=134537 RepID=UPI0038B896D4